MRQSIHLAQYSLSRYDCSTAGAHAEAAWLWLSVLAVSMLQQLHKPECAIHRMEPHCHGIQLRVTGTIKGYP